MKKLVISFSILSLISTVIFAVTSQQILERTITGIHTKTFSVANLYKTKLDTTEWNDIIDNKTYDFVKEHYDAVKKQRDKNIKSTLSSVRSSTTKRNKTLLENYEKIKSANNELIKTIHIAYTELFESNPPKDRALLIEKLSKKFISINKKMENLTEYLKKDLAVLKDTIKNELDDEKKDMLKEQEQVVTVLHRIALTLKLTAKKSENDLKK